MLEGFRTAADSPVRGARLRSTAGVRGSVFPKATGNVVDKNTQGQQILEDILTNSGTKASPNKSAEQKPV